MFFMHYFCAKLYGSLAEKTVVICINVNNRLLNILMIEARDVLICKIPGSNIQYTLSPGIALSGELGLSFGIIELLS